MSIKKFAIADGNKTTDESSLPTGGVTAANQGEDDALAPQVASHASCHDTKSGDEKEATRQTDSLDSPIQEEISDRRRFNGKAGASGWIEKYYKTRDAAGLSQTVSGGLEHSGCSWPYFHYQWKEGLRTRTRYVPREKVEAIEQAIARRAPYAEVLALL